MKWIIKALNNKFYDNLLLSFDYMKPLGSIEVSPDKKMVVIIDVQNKGILFLCKRLSSEHKKLMAENTMLSVFKTFKKDVDYTIEVEK